MMSSSCVASVIRPHTAGAAPPRELGLGFPVASPRGGSIDPHQQRPTSNRAPCGMEVERIKVSLVEQRYPSFVAGRLPAASRQIVTKRSRLGRSPAIRASWRSARRTRASSNRRSAALRTSGRACSNRSWTGAPGKKTPAPRSNATNSSQSVLGPPGAGTGCYQPARSREARRPVDPRTRARVFGRCPKH